MTLFLDSAIAKMLPGAGDGETCAECGFAWSTDGDEAIAILRGATGRFTDLVHGRDATLKPDPQTWSPSAYVWHVSDVIRTWGERLHGLGRDADVSWSGFDPDELARARGYDGLPQVTGPWALARSTDTLLEALQCVDLDTDFVHPEWGHGTVADALRWVAHEIVHHDLDVRRGLGLA